MPTSKSLLLALIIAAATGIAYYPATQCGFIWDDDDYVLKNKSLRDWNGLKNIWLDTKATPQYYPLVHSTFWCEYQLWGLNASGFHVTNIIIHIVNALLLWRLLKRLDVDGAWLAAMIFAVHPVHVESVAWITERKNVLSGLYYLAAIHAFLNYWNFLRPIDQETSSMQTADRGRWLWYAFANACFVAALLSKTVTATLPAVLLVLMWWKQGRIVARHFLCVLPMLVIGIVFGMITVWLEKFQVGASGMDWQLTFLERCLVAGRAIWFYAGKLLWPANLIFTYPRWEIDSSQTWQFVFPLAALGLIIALWFLRTRLGRGPLAAVLLFTGTLFPALGFFDVYPMRFSFVADHFQYLASIAIIALTVAVFFRRPRIDKGIVETSSVKTQRFDALRYVVAAVVVLLLMSLTWRQAWIYEGLEPLWRDTLAKNPASFMAHNNLGALLNRRGDFVEAETHLRESMRLKPDFVDSIVNMGKAREGQGDIETAMQYYQKAVEINSSSAVALNGIAAMYGAKGDIEQAEHYFRKAIEADPKYPSARLNLATLLLKRNAPEAAIPELLAVLEVEPGLVAAQEALAKAYLETGKFEEAKTLLESMLATNPHDPNLLGALGMVAANQHKFRTAIHYFEQILEILPGEPMALYNLSQLYRDLGENDRAEAFLRSYQRAVGESHEKP